MHKAMQWSVGRVRKREGRVMSGQTREAERPQARDKTGGVIRVVALGGGEGSWRGRAAVRGLVAGIARHDGVRCVLGAESLRRASCGMWGERSFYAHPLAEPSKRIRGLEEGGAAQDEARRAGDAT